MNPNKWLVLTLIVSLAANFALVGFFTGRASGAGMGPPFADPMFGAGRVLHDLPEARRRELRSRLSAHSGGMRTSLRQLRRVQHHLEETFMADPFVEADLAGALDQFRDNLCSSMQESHASFVALSAALTAEERRNVHFGGRGGRPPHTPGPWGPSRAPQRH